jgi:6-phosphogluconolactonase
VTTNFSSNEVMVFRLDSDGSIAEVAARIAPSTAGLAPPPPPGTHLPQTPEVCRTPARTIADNCRTKPHIALLSPKEGWLIVAEIATDALAIYRMDQRTGQIELAHMARGQDGGGPRHLAFSIDGRFLYSSDEHGSAVSTWHWNEARGEARHLQTVSTLPVGYSGPNTTSHIALHSGGRALWVANRGSETIACFRIDPRSGMLTAAGHAPTGGRDCWCFDLDATGLWLIAGNVSGDFLQAYRVNPATAALAPEGRRLAASFPTCIRLWP